jgi:hypothetical protein
MNHLLDYNGIFFGQIYIIQIPQMYDKITKIVMNFWSWMYGLKQVYLNKFFIVISIQILIHGLHIWCMIQKQTWIPKKYNKIYGLLNDHI